ncbi:MAG: GyrI-like domain-containing protein [Actinobacteria bacterium]|nr:GyrI-like domain-containing protein [Actinomycetota bacterium]
MSHEITIEQRYEQPTAVVSGRVAHDGIPEFIGGAFGEVLAAIGGENSVAGPPFARYDIDGSGFVVEAGFPVTEPVTAIGRVAPSRLPGGTVATLRYVGAYEGLGDAYGALEEWLDVNGFTAAGRPWECYIDGPEAPEPRTLVCWPCTRS